MEIGNVSSTPVMGPERIGKSITPMPEDLTPEVPPREEAHCTLHISEEGYRRWELARQDNEPQTDLSSTTSEELPQVENTSASEALRDSGNGEDRVAAILQFIDNRTDILKNAAPEATKATDDEKAAALEQLRQLKEDQEAEYQAKAQEAQDLARQQTKVKSAVEKGMRDLSIMLESFNPLQSTGADEKERSRMEPENTVRESIDETSSETLDRKEKLLGAGGQIKQQAFQKELSMDSTIDGIYEKAMDNFKTAKSHDRHIRDGLEAVYHTLQDENCSEEEKDTAVNDFLENGTRFLSEMKTNLSTGLERMRNIRDIKRGRLDNQNMIYAKQAQVAVEESASQSTIDQLYQNGYEALEEETIEELEEHIRNLQNRPNNTNEQNEIEDNEAEQSETRLDAAAIEELDKKASGESE